MTQAVFIFDQIIIFIKSAMIRFNFDIFFRIFNDLVAKFKINKVYICCQGKARAASIGAKNTAEVKALHYLQFHGITDKHTA